MLTYHQAVSAAGSITLSGFFQHFLESIISPRPLRASHLPWKKLVQPDFMSPLVWSECRPTTWSINRTGSPPTRTKKLIRRTDKLRYASRRRNGKSMIAVAQRFGARHVPQQNRGQILSSNHCSRHRKIAILPKRRRRSIFHTPNNLVVWQCSPSKFSIAVDTVAMNNDPGFTILPRPMQRESHAKPWERNSTNVQRT